MSSNAIKNKLFSKAFWKSRNGQLTFCVAGGAFSILFLLIQFGAFSSGLLPNAAAEERLEKELKKLQQTQKELESDLAAQEEVRKQAAAKFNGAWKNSVHGVPEVELRSMLENTARDMDLRYNQLSMVKKVSFNQDLTLLEIDVDLTVDIDSLVKFLMAVHALKPELYWKRFDCRMIQYYGMPAIRFVGTLRCVNDLRPEKASGKPGETSTEPGGRK